MVNCLVNTHFMEIGISEFKAKCIQLIKSTAENEEELIVTLRGKPLARVVGVLPARHRRLGGQHEAFGKDVPDSVLVHSDLSDDWES